MNPLFGRELRARWRDRRSWWLLLTLVLALALLANWMFSEGVNRRDEQYMVRARGGGYTMRVRDITPTAKAARAGRELFAALSVGNVVAWLLIAPILAATPIARERERGLLESLQLSHLSPLSQIAARYGAALIFLLALQLAMMPVYAIVFWLGGVSPGELGLAALIICLVAAGGIALGTWISARSHRPSSALFSALGTVVLWTLALLPALYGVALPGAGVWYYPAAALFWTHPLPLIYSLVDPDGQLAGILSPPFGTDISQIIGWNCALWSALILLWLALSVRLIRTALETSSWGPQASAPVERWQRSLRARETAAREAATRQTEASQGAPSQGEPRLRRRAGQRVEGALIADLPLENLARFSDPLLKREVRARFRLRRGGWGVVLGRLILFGVGAFVCAWSLFALFDPPSRADVAPALCYFLWGLGALTVGALSSSGFAREREGGTWEGLKLSLLTPGEIVRAKWLSPLVSFGYYSAALWVLLPVGVLVSRFQGMNALTLTLCVGIVALSLGTISMLGLWISWRAKAPNAALGWVLGLGVILFIAVPIARESTDVDSWLVRTFYGVNLRPYFDQSWNSPEYQRAVNARLWSSLWHPVTALGHTQNPRGTGNYGSYDGNTLDASSGLLAQLLIFTLVAGGGAWSLCRSIARDAERGAGG